jgi:hypothetical protein
MKKNFLPAILILLTSVSFISCRRNLYDIDVSGIKINVRIKRLEKDLFEISPGHIIDSLDILKARYDGFLKYFGYVINIGEPGDTSWIEGLVRFCTDKLNNELYQSTITAFPALDNLENGLSDAFRRYRYYFPSKPVPGLFTCITGFNNSIITGDSVLAIGLDKYLGPENDFYRQLRIYKYQLERMKPDNILPDCIYGWASSEWSLNNMHYRQENVLTDIIHEGKLIYFTKCLLPSVPDEKIMGFNPDQMKFCRNNEGLMWQYLVEHNILFSTDMLTRKKLTGEAPFTTYFTSESPGRAAVWTGFRIVESYMKRNRSVSLEKLMEKSDVQEILEKSMYRPSAGI